MSGKKILVCDDDEGITEMLKLLLDDEGYEVSIEMNSVNLLKRLEVEKPDLVLLDIWMPVLSGDQVLRNIKATPSLSRIPILMYSASTEGKNIAKAAGADGFIAKPFDVNKLLAMIKSM